MQRPSVFLAAGDSNICNFWRGAAAEESDALGSNATKHATQRRGAVLVNAPVQGGGSNSS